nr:DNA polymerase alpha catalytic subunit-like isoform X2 [Nicotiana tomentosiformis]XP_018621923.1 DNA polymerase alpha catalytic subunit-like isoform X3 [Nicotiana tomentosiformis]XP_033508636.1 DNA polymerase alpha catalytic subunit-like isoform X1 [Nicotiana tomentosiformis]
MRANEEWLEILDGVFQENSFLSNRVADRKGNIIDGDEESEDEDQLDDQDFIDPDCNLEEDDDDYHEITDDDHDIVVENYFKNAKERPKKNTNDRNNGGGPSADILIPEITRTVIQIMLNLMNC